MLRFIYELVDDMAIIEMYVIFRCDVLCWDILCMFIWWFIRRRDVSFLFVYFNCV